MIATAFRNGHHELKATGDTVYRGPLTQLPPPRPVTSPEAAAEAMFSDGFVQFPDLLSPEDVATLRAWMDRSGGPDAQYEVKNWCFNKHIGQDFAREPNWLRLIDRDPAFEVLRLILGDGFIAVGGSLWITGPGRGMGMHLDRLFLQLPPDVAMDPRVRVPVHSCTLHYYLDDQVEEIGPTLVIPGSHRAGHAPHDESTWNGIAPQMISVRAGGAVLFRHDLWHGAVQNTSTRRRYLIQVHYGDSTKQFGYRPLAYGEEGWSPEVLAQLTERQRVLLGAKPSGIFPR